MKKPEPIKVQLDRPDPSNQIYDLATKLKKSNTPFYVAVVPINPEGEVLLGLRKEDGIWTSPAGGANEGESPEDCAVRECWEEANLLVNKNFLELLSIKQTPNNRTIYCYLYRTAQLETNTKMDPDSEVKEWVWYSPENLPAGLRRKCNHNRLETINEAFMKWHGLTKSELTAKSNYGPRGAGMYSTTDNATRKNRNRGESHDSVGQNKNVKPWSTSGSLTQQEHEKKMEKEQREKAKESLKQYTPDELAEYAKKKGLSVSSQGRGPDKKPRKKRTMSKSEEISELVNELRKGGPGSGKRGHRTNKQNLQIQKNSMTPPVYSIVDRSGRVYGTGYISEFQAKTELKRAPRVQVVKKSVDKFKQKYPKGSSLTDAAGWFRTAGGLTAVEVRQALQELTKVTQTFPSMSKAEEISKLTDHLRKATWKVTMKNGVRRYASGPHIGKEVGSIRRGKKNGDTAPKSAPSKKEKTKKESKNSGLDSIHPKGSAKYRKDHKEFYQFHSDKGYEYSNAARDAKSIEDKRKYRKQAEKHFDTANYHSKEAVNPPDKLDLNDGEQTSFISSSGDKVWAMRDARQQNYRITDPKDNSVIYHDLEGAEDYLKDYERGPTLSEQKQADEKAANEKKDQETKEKEANKTEHGIPPGDADLWGKLKNLENSEFKIAEFFEDLGISASSRGRDSGNHIFSDDKIIRVSLGLDRYRRHDHGGGEDGDDWLSSEDIDEDMAEGQKTYGSLKTKLEKKLKEQGVQNARVSFDLGEKGHFSLNLSLPNPNRWNSRLKNMKNPQEAIIEAPSGEKWRYKEMNDRGQYIVENLKDPTKRAHLDWNTDYKIIKKSNDLSKALYTSKSLWEAFGAKVEMEHTNDKEKALKIARDHLAEDPDYYKDWKNKEKILFQPKAPKIEKSDSFQVRGDQELVDILYDGMLDFEFGDIPIEFEFARGILHLSRVDTDLYSGYFTIPGDDVKVRIDKISIPDLATLLITKEWVLPNMSHHIPVAEIPELPSKDSSDRTERILELVNKLLSL